MGRLILPGLNYVVSVVLLGLLFGAIYKVLPDRSLQWKDVIVGAVITSIFFNIGKSLDREEKRIVIRDLPRRSGGWTFRFDIDKITDEETARAVKSIDGSQAKYELVVSCRSGGSEFLVSTFESGGTQSKRIPWDIDLGVGAYRNIRLRIDSNPPFTTRLFMRGYGNYGQVELGAEFLNLIRGSRLVLADVFPDEQVEVPTAYPMEFKRLCELLSAQFATRAHH